MQKELFSQILFGEMQSYGAVAAFPVVKPAPDGALNYLTLVEAMEQMMIKILEVSEGGSVPELKVVNNAPLPVLLLSGEEVKGAKQNRIVNTSILIPALSSIVIPVSCTERGRWHYDAPDFKDSGNISNIDVRRSADETVRENLEMGYGHRSDQGRVWEKIEALHMNVGSDKTSHTRAMNDAFKTREHDLEEAMKHFQVIPRQAGIMVFFEGKVAGMDMVSKPAAYARLHSKLVKSYLIDCLGKKGKSAHDPEHLQKEALRFLDKAASGEVKVFKSVGLGEDHRITAPEVQGSMLVFAEEAVHTCCFRREPAEDRMVGFHRRNQLI
jgi:hypothetical protein